MICQIEERQKGGPYPRTCPACGLGPCAKGLVYQTPRQQIETLKARLDAAAHIRHRLEVSLCHEVLRRMATDDKLAALREAASGVVEAYDWWAPDEADRDLSVLIDAIEDLRNAMQETTNG